MLTLVLLELLLGSRGSLPTRLLLYKLFPELSVAMPWKTDRGQHVYLMT